VITTIGMRAKHLLVAAVLVVIAFPVAAAVVPSWRVNPVVPPGNQISVSLLVTASAGSEAGFAGLAFQAPSGVTVDAEIFGTPLGPYITGLPAPAGSFNLAWTPNPSGSGIFEIARFTFSAGLFADSSSIPGEVRSSDVPPVSVPVPALPFAGFTPIVPEPSAALLGCAMLGILMLRR
jgi:hypothetical protein